MGKIKLNKLRLIESAEKILSTINFYFDQVPNRFSALKYKINLDEMRPETIARKIINFLDEICEVDDDNLLIAKNIDSLRIEAQRCYEDDDLKPIYKKIDSILQDLKNYQACVLLKFEGMKVKIFSKDNRKELLTFAGKKQLALIKFLYNNRTVRAPELKILLDYKKNDTAYISMLVDDINKKFTKKTGYDYKLIIHTTENGYSLHNNITRDG